MHEFRFLDYHTEYACSGTFTKKMNVEACFSYVFYRVTDKSSEHYEIVLQKGVNASRDKHYSNACLFDRKEIKNHIRILKSLYPLKSKVLRGKDNTFIIHLDIEGVPATFHKYALTWVRYLYEYPYNVILKDAYRLHELPQFKFESIANLFNLGIGCFNGYPRDIHQVPVNAITERLPRKELREKLQKVDMLNRLYKRVKKKESMLPNKLGEYSNTDIEYWSDDLFDQRLKVYTKVYNSHK